MKAWVVGSKRISLVETAQPTPGSEQVLIRVHAAALNRGDIRIATGLAGQDGQIAGSECAGEVVAAGKGAQLKAGDRVMGVTTGAFAEFAVADHIRAYRIPDGLSFEEAATLPMSLSTMHNAVLAAGAFKRGETILVQGASSGVGLMAMQVAREKGASLVIGTSTSAARLSKLGEFGADIALDSSRSDWVNAVLEATGGKGVDLVVDQISGPITNANMHATRLGGRIVSVGRLGGERAEFDFDLHALRRIDFIGVTFRTRSLDEIRAISNGVRSDLWDAVVQRRLTIPIDSTFPMSQLPKAVEHMSQNQHFGKIILQIR